MRLRTVLFAVLILVSSWGAAFAQKEWQEYQGESNGRVPADYREPHDWVEARLMYRDAPGMRGGFGFGRDSWTTDYPGGDRSLIRGVRRLTRIDARSVEQAVELDETDDVYNWPFLYAVEVGRWGFIPSEAEKLREFLLRGGFLMVDDFHGSQQWEVFQEGLEMVFPDRQIEDLPSSDPIFHILSDIDLSVQVPGQVSLGRGGYELDGITPRWRGIRNDHGDVIVAICHNMDLGDAWEHSDKPWYPADMAVAAHHVLQNYAIYDLTH